MRPIVLAVLIVAGLFGLVSADAQTAPNAPSAPDCSAPEYRQLDYWLGDWTVQDTASSVVIATSHVEKIAGQCAIRELYRSPKAPGGPYEGTSYSSWDRKDRRWHQLYVDTHGAVDAYVGGSEAGTIVLTTKTAAGKILRMAYRRMPDGAVRQIGDVSADGTTWTPSYDYTYRKRAIADGSPDFR